MRIGLNLLHVMPEIGGGWNYIGNLVGALGDYDPVNSYVAFVTRQSRGLLPEAPNFEMVLADIDPAVRAWRVLYENTVLPSLVRAKGVECLHWFSGTLGFMSPVPNVVTIYDLQAFKDLAKIKPGKRIYLRFMSQRAILKADLLLPISEFTSGEIQETFGVVSRKMVTIPSIIPARWKPCPLEEIQRIRMRHGLPDRFWFFVAHFYPHKNHLRLLEAMGDMRTGGRPSWPLVLRGDPHGSERDVKEAVRRFGLAGNVIFLPRLEENDLRALYSAASALIFPSLYEGSGMPVMEAMACGCPIVASDIPPVRENAGDAAITFQAKSPASIARVMAEFQEIGEQARAIMIGKGLALASRFRPEPIIARLVEAYRSAPRGGNGKVNS
jgi:glycosyltransferase involved in cell wall biosynthesis